MGHPRHLWMLDVDGPVADPVTRAVDAPRILEAIATALTSGAVVVFNTGRAASWVMGEVIAPLRQTCASLGLDADSLLDDCLVVAEKGAETVSFEHGHARSWIDPHLSVDAGVAKAVAALVAADYADAMFVDPAKRTMVSVEMARGMAIDDYAPRQAAFAIAAQAIVDAVPTSGLRVDVTTIAVDIEMRSVGKGLGAARALDWLASRGDRIVSAFCVGDSGSDLAMADHLYETLAPGTPLTYVNVGAPSALDRPGNLRYTVVHALRAPGNAAPAFASGTVAAMSRSRETAGADGEREVG